MAPEWLNLQPPQLLFSYSNRVLSGARNIIEYITSIYFNIDYKYMQAFFHIKRDNSRPPYQTPGITQIFDLLHFGNCLDLDQNILRKPCNFNTASCRIISCKILCIDFINLCKIIHVLDKYYCLNNLIR